MASSASGVRTRRGKHHRVGLNTSPGQAWFWLNVSNFAAYGMPTLIFNHFWSLAIEEQFYLVWPLLVLICGSG